MRKIEYLSPTSISQFYSDMTEFYMKYLAEKRPPRLPQTAPMAVGSSFDAFVKSYLYERLFGKLDPKFELMAIFETQVESHNRDVAYEAGKHVFEEYKKSGCLSDLLMDLSTSLGEPRFEFEVKGVINGYKEGITKSMQEVTFLGKPDIFFTNKEGAKVIHDWKVNGYYSKYNISPMQGFVRIRDQTGQNKGQHKDAMCIMKKGVLINAAHSLENLNDEWARQLAIYAWLCGEEVGGDFICSVDQVVCNATQGTPPKLRFAEHRLKVSSAHQYKVFAEAQHVWEVVHSDHIFRNMSQEDSKSHCDLLDQSIEGLKSSGDVLDDWFNQMARS